jgi:hypothetical protein
VEFSETLAPIKALPSAKLNYTLEDGHLFVKGQNVKSAGYGAIIPVANAIASSVRFKGAGFSLGDQRIYDIAAGHVRPGGAPQWKSAAANHHITLVYRALLAELGIRVDDRAVEAEGRPLLSLFEHSDT